MRRLIRSALVIARRDYVATVWSKTFILFLIGPMLPILFGGLIATISTRDEGVPAARPALAVAMPAADASRLRAASARLEPIDPLALPPVASYPAGSSPRDLLRRPAIDAVLTGTLAHPRLSARAADLDRLAPPVAALIDAARAAAATPVTLTLDRVAMAPPAAPANHGDIARGGQLVLLVLTMILAGMLLSNLIEEKSNKVIEVLAAAVPVDAIFIGKLAAMLGMSLTGIAIWGSLGFAAAHLLLPAGISALGTPAVGWPAFVALGIVYFVASYLLIGAVFLGIGAQAASVREVQTLSMPITMGQLVIFAFASAGVGHPGGALAIAAALFPWSSPIAMMARAAELPSLWPHLAALGWQALWIALAVRVAARAFRRSVLDAGARRGLFRRRG